MRSEILLFACLGNSCNFIRINLTHTKQSEELRIVEKHLEPFKNTYEEPQGIIVMTTFKTVG